MGGPRVALAVAVALVIGLASLAFFLSVFGDPYGRGFVERRENGLYAQLRPCDGDRIHAVEVSRDEHATTGRREPIWSATSTTTGATAVQLFSPQPEFAVSGTPNVPVPDTYVVVINPGRPSESWVTVAGGSIAHGEVEYGGDHPVPLPTYLAMPSSDFGCAP